MRGDAGQTNGRTALEALMARIDTARAAIVEREHGATNVDGEIDCPICGTGQLLYEITGPRHHIRARCTTHRCVHWIE
jgi:hypothetical protein